MKVTCNRDGLLNACQLVGAAVAARTTKPVLSNLAMEISFSESPQASASQAILSTSAALAAACVPPALKQGVGAFFFFASDDAMRLLFQQPQIAAFRPPVAGSARGGTGGVTPGGV